MAGCGFLSTTVKDRANDQGQKPKWFLSNAPTNCRSRGEFVRSGDYFDIEDRYLASGGGGIRAPFGCSTTSRSLALIYKPSPLWHKPVF